MEFNFRFSTELKESRISIYPLVVVADSRSNYFKHSICLISEEKKWEKKLEWDFNRIPYFHGKNKKRVEKYLSLIIMTIIELNSN